MKKSFIRKIAALLCVLTVCALFPLTTGAYSDAFTTVTYLKDKKEYSRLYMPAKGNFYTSKDKLPRRAEVKASWKNGCIVWRFRGECVPCLFQIPVASGSAGWWLHPARFRLRCMSELPVPLTSEDNGNGI